MELDTRELFRCLARDCNYHDEKLCDVSKRQITMHETIYCFQSSSSWRFMKFSEALHVCSNRNFYVHNHVSQKAKGETSNWDAIANRETAIQVLYKQCSRRKNTLIVDTDDQKFNCNNADGHSKTGNRKTKIGKLNSKDKLQEQKQWEALWDCSHTVDRTFNYLHKLPFIVDLTDIKSWIVFKFNQWTDDFCYFNDANCRSNIYINVSTQSIIQAMRINANFLKSCQLLLYLEFA